MKRIVVFIAAVVFALSASSAFASTTTNLRNALAAYEHIGYNAEWAEPYSGTFIGAICSKHYYSSGGVQTVSSNTEWDVSGTYTNNGNVFHVTNANRTAYGCDPSTFGNITSF